MSAGQGSGTGGERTVIALSARTDTPAEFSSVLREQLESHGFRVHDGLSIEQRGMADAAGAVLVVLTLVGTGFAEQLGAQLADRCTRAAQSLAQAVRGSGRLSKSGASGGSPLARIVDQRSGLVVEIPLRDVVISPEDLVAAIEAVSRSGTDRLIRLDPPARDPRHSLGQ